MSTEGDGEGQLRVNLDPYALKKVIKDYKKIKKYMRSPIYQIKKMEGSETLVTKLMKEIEET